MDKSLNILGVTGHRKLEHQKTDIVEAFRQKISGPQKPDVVISGMALGYDTLVVQVCIEEDVPYIAAVPYKGQEKFWRIEDKLEYQRLIKEAWKIKLVSPGGYAAWKLFKRNEWIVDNSTRIVSYWNGLEKGGTYRCLEYAKKKSIPSIVNLYSGCCAR